MLTVDGMKSLGILPSSADSAHLIYFWKGRPWVCEDINAVIAAIMRLRRSMRDTRNSNALNMFLLRPFNNADDVKQFAMKLPVSWRGKYY